MTIKSNAAWDALCDLTTQLFTRFGSRRDAFKAACRQRPDLAANAIDPTGRRVMRGKAAAQSSLTAEPDIVRACERLARESSADCSPLAAAVERLAAESR